MRCANASRLPWRAAGLLVAIVLAACSGESRPAPSPTAPVSIAALSPEPANTPESPRLDPTHPPTDVPTATPTRTVTPTPVPTLTPTSTPTPTAAPTPVRLTAGGCCTQPFWSSDSRQVRFIDRPGTGSPLGIWGVSVDAPGDDPVLVTERVEESLARGDYLVEAGGVTTTIRRLSDGKSWPVNAARGRNVLLSPDQRRIAWSITNDDLPPDKQVAAVWVANLDGSGARQVASLRRGSLSGWISEDALMVSGRENAGGGEQVLSVLVLADATLTELARAPIGCAVPCSRLRAPGWPSTLPSTRIPPKTACGWPARLPPPGTGRRCCPASFSGPTSGAGAPRAVPLSRIA